MTLMIELPKDLEKDLQAEAKKLGLPIAEYAIRLLYSRRSEERSDGPTNGAELIAYWQDAQLIGVRQDIVNSQAYARNLREQAEKR